VSRDILPASASRLPVARKHPVKPLMHEHAKGNGWISNSSRESGSVNLKSLTSQPLSARQSCAFVSLELPKRKKSGTRAAKLALTNIDVKKLWRIFADTLAKKGLEADVYCANFNETIIRTEAYDANRKAIVDLARHITTSHEASSKGVSVLRIELPPPATAQTHPSGTAPLGQESLRPVQDLQSLDDKLCEYILQRSGEISRTQASQDLGVTPKEIDSSIERLCSARRLSLLSVEPARVQIQRCVHCYAEIPLNSRFCSACGQLQETHVGVEASASDRSMPSQLETASTDWKELKEDIRHEGQRIRFTLPRPFAQRRAAKQSRTIRPRPWGVQKPHPPRKPLERVSSGPLPNMLARTCTRCKHIMKPLGHGNRWYCDRCRRYG